jgi:hypothetical protein
MASLKFGHLIHFVPQRCLKGVVEKSLCSSGSCDGIFGDVDGLDVDCAGKMGFFLFPSGRAFSPGKLLNPASACKLACWFIVACVLLKWFEDHQLGMQASHSVGIKWMDAMNCPAGTAKSQLIICGDLVQSGLCKM